MCAVGASVGASVGAFWSRGCKMGALSCFVMRLCNMLMHPWAKMGAWEKKKAQPLTCSP